MTDDIYDDIHIVQYLPLYERYYTYDIFNMINFN